MVTVLTVYDDPIHTSSTGEDRWADFSDALEISGRTLSGTPTITEFTAGSETSDTITSSTDLSITGVALNTSAITLTNGDTIAANMAVVYNVDASGSTAGTWYHLRIVVATSSGETIARNVRFKSSAT